MMRIGWFTPVSQRTGISSYSAQVLEAMKARFSPEELDVVVYHPATSDRRVEMPYPTIALSDDLIGSDFHALFDVAVYHLGNNSINHAPIYAALMRHPGITVMHDHVYQHYLAGVSLSNGHIGQSFVTLVQNADLNGFKVLKSAGVLRSDRGSVAFVPWESEWATRVPLGDRLAKLGLAAVVHSDYARRGLGDLGEDEALTLFMPRPEIEAPAPPRPVEGARIRIVAAGHIGSTKGLELLIDSFVHKPALREAFHVIVAGFGSDPNYLAYLQETIHQSGLGHVFEVRTGLSDEEFNHVMATSDIFYNLRYPNTEGASLSLMEQLAHGRPVIAYRTGSFAEFPDEACYFLDRIGDEKALCELLEEIAADPQALTRKGEAARAAVEDLTADEYARRFIAYVSERLPAFRRRSGVATARSRGELPRPTNEDLAWFASFTSSRKEMKAFYDDQLFLPDNFSEMSPRAKGDFLAANILGIRIERDTAKQIGEILEKFDPIEYEPLFGLFITLASLGSEKAFLKKYLNKAALPVTDGRLWRILSLLPVRSSAFLVLRALGLPAGSKPSSEFADEVEASGFRAALNKLIDGDAAKSEMMAQLISATPLAEFLSLVEMDDVLALPAVPLGKNMVATADSEENLVTAPVLMQGFHSPEPVGVWSNSLQSNLFVNVSDGRPVTTISGDVSRLFGTECAIGPVRIEVEELASGRRESLSLDFAQGSMQKQSWELPLPGFSGGIRVGFEIDEIQSPMELGLSSDNRQLGVWVRELFLRDDASIAIE